MTGSTDMRVVATAGHVDHGKSTLLRRLTGMEPDRWEEERRRGLTIDLGFVWCDLEGPAGETLTVAFVDVPGHERFVANMLAGAGAVRLALFVVAADDGWSAQSQEHLEILDLLGVSAALVAVTKAGVGGTERTAEVVADVERRLAGTSLEGAPVLAVDALDGTGIDRLRATLAQRLAAASPLPDRGRARLWVDRAFTISGAGTVVTGTLEGGSLRSGQEVAILPNGRSARVRGLQSLGRDRDEVRPGSRVAVNLAGIDRTELARGHALVTSGPPGAARIPAASAWLVTTAIDAWVRALPGREVGRQGAWHLHAGSAEVLATVHPLLDAPIDAGTPGFARIELASALPLQSGDRFVLRESGRRATCGGGEVVDPRPPSRARGTDARLDRAEALEAVLAAGPAGRRLAGLVAASGGGRPAAEARAAAGHPAHAPLPEGLSEVGSHLVDDLALRSWQEAVAGAAARHHEASPESPGAARADLAAAAEEAGCAADLAGALVDHLAATGTLRRDGSAYALAAFAPARDEAKDRRVADFLARLDAEPFAPPPLDEAARAAGLGHEEITALVHAGAVVRCGAFGFARAAVDAAVARLRALEDAEGPFTASQARAALGTTRKWAIPLLEHLDRSGRTRFDGHTRRVV